MPHRRAARGGLTIVYIVTQYTVAGKRTDLRPSITVGPDRPMAALRFVRNLRPDLEKSHIAQDGSVLYGCDGFNYTIERYKA